MVVVLDCNIIVMSLASKSKYHSIYKALIRGDFELAITAEIALEYEEIIQRKYNLKTAQAFLSLLKELPNVHYIVVHFNWMLIEADVDDNKYVDCAIASRANYIVTEDKHFAILKNISFPKLRTISIDRFMAQLV